MKRNPLGEPERSAAEAVAELADLYLFQPPRPELRGGERVDGWAMALRHDRVSGAQWRERST